MPSAASDGARTLAGLSALVAGFQKAVLPNWSEAAMLAFIAVSSFGGQVMLNMSYQMLPASYAAGLSYIQVRRLSEVCAPSVAFR